MGAYLSTPVREKISDDKSTDKLIYGVSSMQGWRISQEDAHNCNPEFDGELDTSFFAIYDGHGGAEVAQYASKNLPSFLKKMPAYKEDLGQALVDAFLQFDETIIHEEVLKELKEMAGVESDGEPEQDEEEEKEAAMLFEEADMPLEKLLERYTSSGGGRQLNKLRQSAKAQSPMICAKKESSTKDSGSEARTNNGDVKAKLDEEFLVNGKKDSDLKSADSGIVVDNQSSTDTSEAKSQQKSDCVMTKEAVSVDCKSTSNNGCSQSGQDADSGPTGRSSSPSAVSSTTPADGSAGGSSSKSPGCSNSEPGSSVGKKASKRKNVIPAEGEDESSCSEESTDEDEWRSSEDEAGEGEGEPDSEDDEDDEEEEDDEGAMMGGTGEPGFDSGCTAVVAVLRGKQLYVANAGDSRCVVCRDGKAVDMSIDHKPEDEPEQTRINNAGGKVTFDGRVNGGLNLSRALGDHCYKKNEDLGPREQMITSLPDIKSITLDDKDEFMVLACDGIWNVMTSQDVVNTVRERLKSDVSKLSSICEELFEMCLAPDTTGDGTGCDNMTCMIIDLRKLHKDGTKETTAAGKRRADEPSDMASAGQPDCKKAKTSESDVPESRS